LFGTATHACRCGVDAFSLLAQSIQPASIKRFAGIQPSLALETITANGSIARTLTNAPASPGAGVEVAAWGGTGMNRMFSRAYGAFASTAICQRCKSTLSPDGSDECPQCGALVGTSPNHGKVSGLAAHARRLLWRDSPFARTARHYASTPDDIVAAPPRRVSRLVLMIGVGVASLVIAAIIGDWIMDPLSMPNRPSAERRYEPAVSANRGAAAQIPDSSPAAASSPPRDLNDGAGPVFMALNALGLHNLSLARQQLSNVPADQAFSSGYLDTDVMLTRLEASRDAALHAALACAKTNSWSCVRTNADKAAAIDVGSEEAAALSKMSSHWTSKAQEADRVSSARPVTHVAEKRHERTQILSSARHHENARKPATRKLEANKGEANRRDTKKRVERKHVTTRVASVDATATAPRRTPAPIIDRSQAVSVDPPRPPRSKGRGEAH
jgi:hypothetical protein